MTQQLDRSVTPQRGGVAAPTTRPAPPATTPGRQRPRTPRWIEGVVPRQLPGAGYRGVLVEAARDRILIRVPSVGRFLVERGTSPVRVERAPAACDADLACIVGGPVTAAALLLGGEPPLRAAVVSIAGAGVLICGPSASGKSTVAAALALRGHAVLSDRIAALRPPGAPGRPVVAEPLDREVQLWPDMAVALGQDPDSGRVVRPSLGKRAYHLGDRADRTSIRTVVRLSIGHQDPADEPARPGDRVTALINAGWHTELVEPLGTGPAQFALVTAMAGECRFVTIGHEARRCRTPERLAELIEDVVQ